MAEFLGDSRRSHYCGTINESITGKEVAVAGWCSKQRDLGQLIFIDLRDRTGIVQLAFDDKTNRDLFEKAAGVRSEFVLFGQGIVRNAPPKTPNIPTGMWKLRWRSLRYWRPAKRPL